jgi:TatD-related deoxyribonuclease
MFDNHVHLRRDGRFQDAVKEFKKEGGTHLVLCQYPMPLLVIRDKSYRSCYLETLKMAEEIHDETNVEVFVTVGPYPADYLKLKEKFGRDVAMELMKKGIDEAAEFCMEKERCIGIGEIGRPHFPVDKETMEDSNKIMLYGMEKASDVDVPVVLHTESTSPEQCKELVEMGKEAGLSPDRIVKHFSPPLIRDEENHGLMPSVLASRRNIVEALKKGTRFMMETDYLDDPRRPGAVLGPKTVPKITKKLLREGYLDEKQIFEIHVENPCKTYGIDIV